MTRSDELLIEEYRAGVNEAFTELMNRHLGNIYSYLARLTDQEAANDLVQDTFFKVWRALGTYDPTRASFKTWLMRIARNTAYDYLRKRKFAVLSQFDTEDGNPLVDSLTDESPKADEMAIFAEEVEVVERAVAKLPMIYREVFALYYGNEYETLEEVAAVLGKSINTVKSQHRRALVLLREVLTELRATS